MPTDGIHHSPHNSAFSPYYPHHNPNSIGQGVCELVTNQVQNALSCFRTDNNDMQSANWISSPSSHLSEQPMTVHDPKDIIGYSPYFPLNAGNVANCVTVVDEATHPNEHNNAFSMNHQQVYTAGVDNLWVSNISDGAAFNNLNCMKAPTTMPLLVKHRAPSSEQASRRKVYYHQRHHPETSETNKANGRPGAEIKNKNRFSATGASGDCTVIRDSKMSLSSAPPSPNAGSVGGSLGSSICRSQYNLVNPAMVAPAYGFPVSSGVFTGPYFSSKKVSDMSISSTLSSYSSSSLSSTPSLTGVSPRKRRADETCQHSNSHGSHVGCHACSTSDVTAGVHDVRICDRSSTGSVSPIDQLNRYTAWKSDQHQQKRSKNDNDDDNDVVFVSMEPATKLPQEKFGEASSVPKSSLNFLKAKPSQSKSGRKSKKVSSKRMNVRQNVPKPSSIPVSFGTPSCANVNAMFAAPGTYLNNISGYYPASSFATSFTVDSSKGYFLRSSVATARNPKDLNNNIHNIMTTPTSVNQSNSPTSIVSDSRPTTRYHTRSQQKRKEVATQSTVVNSAQTDNFQSTTAISAALPPKPINNKVPSHSQQKASNNSSSIQTSVIRSAAAASSIPDPQQRSSTAFKKIYDIRGIIGVGGGGTVYAGARKSDNVQVAIKQVPKAKVKRWGKLDGRVVPIEFELLHRAAYSGNKGIIGMLDWYERRNSYILVMERPQPVIDLFDYLNQHGALPEKIAKSIFQQVVRAVRHCHVNGVIHRDIKDENVLLNLHTSEAKLIDFGCGTMLKDSAYTEFAGTPEFYPPEWFIERRYEGKKVDAWSLGVLLYTMIEAEVPFQKEKDIIACELRHKRAQTSVSNECRHLIALMLQKDQHKRPNLEEVLQHPWLSKAPRATATTLPPASTSTGAGVMNTRDLYVNPSSSTSVFIPPSPASPPLSEQRQHIHENSFPQHYQCQTGVGFPGLIISQHHGSPASSPAACPLPGNECTVRS